MRSVLTRLAALIAGEGRATAELRLLSCDHNADGKFEAWAGWRLVSPAILEAQPAPAILMIGLRNEAAVRQRFLGEPALLALLNWPGLRYLRYGFDRAELMAVVAAALAGRGAPVPLPSPADLRAAVQPVAHWLQSLGAPLHRGAEDFAAAARGGAALHPTYLNPSERMGDGPRAMLRRLKVVLRACAFLEDRAALEAGLLERVESFANGLLLIEELKARHANALDHPAISILPLAEAASASVLDLARLREHVALIERRAARREAGDA